LEEDDLEGAEKDDAQQEFDPERANRELAEMLGNRQMSESERYAKQALYEKECAMGYFLQTITV
jgi:hypothetical protein